MQLLVLMMQSNKKLNN